jgi:hypothetical protein
MDTAAAPLVGYLHNKLDSSHQTESRSDLITELATDLIQAQWQLLLRYGIVCYERCDDLLVCWQQTHRYAITVLQSEQLRSGTVPSTALLPEIGRKYRRHIELLTLRCCQFTIDHRRELGQNSKAQRKERVDAGSGLMDQSCSKHQLVRSEMGVGLFFRCRCKDR